MVGGQTISIPTNSIGCSFCPLDIHRASEFWYEHLNTVDDNPTVQKALVSDSIPGTNSGVPWFQSGAIHRISTSPLISRMTRLASTAGGLRREVLDLALLSPGCEAHQAKGGAWLVGRKVPVWVI